MPPTAILRPTRRRLCATGSLALLLAAAPAVHAQKAQWPTKPVRVVVAFTAGGTTDILARAVAQKLGEKLGQPFVIDNKPGAGGNIGTGEVVRAEPDGHTLIVNSVGPIAINQTLYKNLPYDPLTDLVPVVQIADVPNVLVVHPSVPANNLKEFLAWVQGNEKGLSWGSPGQGTHGHLIGELFAQQTKIKQTHISYKGASPAIADAMTS